MCPNESESLLFMCYNLSTHRSKCSLSIWAISKFMANSSNYRFRRFNRFLCRALHRLDGFTVHNDIIFFPFPWAPFLVAQFWICAPKHMNNKKHIIGDNDNRTSNFIRATHIFSTEIRSATKGPTSNLVCVENVNNINIERKAHQCVKPDIVSTSLLIFAFSICRSSSRFLFVLCVKNKVAY